jgi:hypothetical protein
MRRIRAMGIRDKPIAPASPWQNGFANGGMDCQYQLTMACGWEQLPRHLIRDRDTCYGDILIRRVF